MKLNNYIIAIGLLFILFSGCQDDDNALKNRTWQLVWEDNFDGEIGQSPDTTRWTYDIGTGDNGWGNQELQYYTDSPDNASLDGEGNLAIVARNESFGGSPFTSARIKTEGIFEQTYGRFEARMKMPYGPGIWPAFWMLGNDINEVSWPQCGEIDIMEYRGQEPNLIHGSLHGPGYSGGSPISKSFGFSNGRFDTDFHVFAIEWGEDYIDYFVDENLFQRITPDDIPAGTEWVYDHPFFIIMNVAIGGNYVGFPTEQTNFPQTMLVDYVRVYSEVK